MLCRTVAFAVVIYAILYCTVEPLDVFAIRSAGLLGKIVHFFYLTFLFIRSTYQTVRDIIDTERKLYVTLNEKNHNQITL